jgi:hypothetical protein
MVSTVTEAMTNDGDVTGFAVGVQLHNTTVKMKGRNAENEKL